jgi:hypothetical protein
MSLQLTLTKPAASENPIFSNMLYEDQSYLAVFREIRIL